MSSSSLIRDCVNSYRFIRARVSRARVRRARGRESQGKVPKGSETLWRMRKGMKKRVGRFRVITLVD